MKSPLLAAPGAVPADGPDGGVAAHYGDPYGEQRALACSAGLVDRSHRGVIKITGPDRLSWLHSLTTQSLEQLAAGDTVEALILSPNGHIEHQLTLTDDRTALWAYEALRIAARRPRLGQDTDHRTIPHEVGWIETAVHLSKGCYRGQETVARVQNLGHPPRRLVFLHLDGSEDALPAHGDPVELAGTRVGFVGSAARHYELGPIALGLIKRTVPVDAGLSAAGIAAAQEVIVPPDTGANVKVTLR